MVVTVSRVLIGGHARGPLLILEEPLSFWGGIDSSEGTIIERSHPQFGRSIAGRILVLPHGRGSSSSSSVFAEALRQGVGPSGMILREPDEILLIGALVARRLYAVECPIVVANVEGDDGQIWTIDDGRLVREENEDG